MVLLTELYISMLLALLVLLVLYCFVNKYVNANSFKKIFFFMLYLLFLDSMLMMSVALSKSFEFCYNMDLQKFLNNDSMNLFSLSFNTYSFMFSCVTVQIAFFVNLYSFYYKKYEPNSPFFFVFLNFFFLSMVFLVHSSNFFNLFFFWECMGLTSFFLMNFFFTKPNVNKSSYKAFSFNKVSDMSLLTALVIYYNNTNSAIISNKTFEFFFFHSLHSKIFFFDVSHFSLFTFFMCVAAFMKSAQFGFHVWLPDSMEAPLPASALMHSATLVAAGMFMFHKFFLFVQLHEHLMSYLTLYFSFTFFYGASVAFFQIDCKKMLAYSTMSNCAIIFLTMMYSHDATFFAFFSSHGWHKSITFLMFSSFLLLSNHKQDISLMATKKFFFYINIFYSVITLMSLASWFLVSWSVMKHLVLDGTYYSLCCASFLYGGSMSSMMYSCKLMNYLIYTKTTNKKKKTMYIGFSMNYIILVFLLFMTMFGANFFILVIYDFNMMKVKLLMLSMLYMLLMFLVIDFD